MKVEKSRAPIAACRRADRRDCRECPRRGDQGCLLLGRQRVRSHAGVREAIRSPESRRQGRHRQGALQGDRRTASGAARRGRRSRHRARDGSRRALQVLPRHHTVCEGPQILGGELRPDTEVAATLADRQGHLRDDDPADRHGAVRQQDAVRSGQGAAARCQCNVGRLGERDAASRQGDPGAVRDGVRP